jgi:hypothetical protein
MLPKKGWLSESSSHRVELNAASHDDIYSMNTVNQSNQSIGDIGIAGSTIFPTFDLTLGFW